MSSHCEGFEDGWRLRVAPLAPITEYEPWTVRASLEKHFTPPRGFTYGCTVKVICSEFHLERCSEAWTELQRAKAGAELGLSTFKVVHDMWVTEEGVRKPGDSLGTFAASQRLFHDEASYLRHQELVRRALSRARVVGDAFQEIGEIPTGVAWKLV